jgi:transcriptional regulator with XRE-family HTH domain
VYDFVQKGGVTMDLQKIGACLRDLRKEKGLTQEQLAERFSVSQRTVSRWETGTATPDLDVLLQLADFYEVDLRALLNGERANMKMTEETIETVRKAAVLTKQKENKQKKKFIWLIAAVFGISLIIALLLFSLIGNCISSRIPGPVKLGANYQLLTDTYEMYQWSSTDYLSVADNPGSIIVVPTFQNADKKTWAYNLILNVYTTDSKTDVKVLDALLVLPDSTVIAAAISDSFVYDPYKKADNGLFYKSEIICENFAEIPDAVLKSEKQMTLLVEYSLNNERKSQEYDVQVSSLHLTLFDLLFE